MGWEEAVAIAVTTGALAYLVGFCMGLRSERKAWTMRALKEDGCGTPHHCDGEFYFIVPEHTFCDEFMRRPRELRRPQSEGDQ